MGSLDIAEGWERALESGDAAADGYVRRQRSRFAQERIELTKPMCLLGFNRLQGFPQGGRLKKVENFPLTFFSLWGVAFSPPIWYNIPDTWRRCSYWARLRHRAKRRISCCGT